MLNGFLRTLMGGPPRVRIVDGAIETAGRGLGATILLTELTEVGILTTDHGPADDDAFWMLRTKQRLYSIPWSADGCDKLLEALQALPGFDHAAVIDASSSTENAAFLAWTKDRLGDDDSEDVGSPDTPKA